MPREQKGENKKLLKNEKTKGKKGRRLLLVGPLFCHIPVERGDEETRGRGVVEHKISFNENIDWGSNEGRHLTADMKTGKHRAYKR